MSDQPEQQIEAMAARVASSVRALVKSGPFEQAEVLSDLESELEWFLTWRLKLPPAPMVMWCDGVRDLSIHSLRNLSYEIKARAYIGPESDATTILCPFDGTIVLDDNSDQLKAYRLNIEYEDQTFTITEAISQKSC